MRQSSLFLPTLREAPAEAEVVSHQLLLRAGFIRQLASGIYSYLPLGWRVLHKVERIIIEEMDKANAQQMLMPALQPAELWQESGRYSIYGPELIRFKDRHAREFALGPTHEEVITLLVRNEISSYKKLPLILYQIQTKFRDERRPRYGLLRGREFLMKDAYSFDKDWEGLDRSYQKMYTAYQQIFHRLELNYRAVEADAGAIGGEGETHEFMALADIGEDTIVSCSSCNYSANLEKAASVLENDLKDNENDEGLEKVHTPSIRSIAELVVFLKIEPHELIKTLIYFIDDKIVAVLVRGDHDVNEIKVKNHFGAENIELADAETTKRVTGAPVGFAGPIGLEIAILVDTAVVRMQSGVTGANEQDYHIRNVRPGRDFDLDIVGDFRNVVVGDHCPLCSDGVLQFSRGIEMGHVFKLGTKYSEKFGAKFLDSNGREQDIIMGCYGIGVSRILSAIVEQNHDSSGMIWPIAIAPFQVHVIPVSIKDQTQMILAELLYQRLRESNVDVLLDDRDERPGIKFNDSDLIGIPYRIVVGKHAEQGIVELKERRDSVQSLMGIDEVLSNILGSLNL